MPDVTLYHNPRCTKSRQTKALLEDQGIEPVIVEYLKTPPDAATLRKLVKLLGIRPNELVRKKEAAFKELGLADRVEDDEAMINAMVEHPILIERPIVVANGQARVGRPPESVREIL